MNKFCQSLGPLLYGGSVVLCGVVIKPWLNLASPFIYFMLKPRILLQNCKKDSGMIARTIWENNSVNSFVFKHSLWCQHRLWVKIVRKRSETTNAIVNKYKNIEPVTLDSHFLTFFCKYLSVKQWTKFYIE